jgi:predicted exporter
MAVFTMLGLGGAWLAVALWLPRLGRRMPEVGAGSLPRLLERAWARWPRLDRGWGTAAALSGLLGLSLWGMARLHPDDDVRQLFVSSPGLLREQERVEELMRLPGGGVFFLVTAPDEQSLLEREEALAADLDEQRRQGRIASFQAVSQFVPSLRRQEADYALQWRRLYRGGGLASRLFAELDSPEVAAWARRQAQAPTPPLTPQAWLNSPLSTPYRPLWLGPNSGRWASVVTLGGLRGPDTSRALAELAGRHPGVRFVDHMAALSGLMGGFRAGIGRLLGLGYLFVAASLFAFYGRDTWRVVAPTALASLYTLGLFGLTGRSNNLFCMLGLVLVLGMGIDYGIFLQDRRAGDRRIALLSASLAASTALLSFGLLALSRTPALRAFGLSMLLGIGLSWLLAPCFQRGDQA